MIPTWLLAGLVANVAIAVTENLNRHAQTDNFFLQLKFTWVPIMIAQFGLFWSWKHAPSMMMAWACFTLGNSLCRVINVQYFTGEGLNFTTMAGVGLMIAAVALVKQGTSL